ncbi:EamA family transporter [Haloarcula nitratireducens]|uniref:DMT family transporter n=1 Tax=Haloarcula nitratireducens TaxID=2487749 RepID=A0AAW4PDX0_9EURY|nr:EamA family transporter [Halomicroarcula nitratireducens]MBX0296177.1 DMT family transporter [Halomicroarcula nitratireducens]
MILELSTGLALLASVFSGLQAVSVEYGMENGEYADDRSPALAAAVVSIVVSVVVFWALLLVRGVSFDALTLGAVAPFVVAGLANPAAFRLLYFQSIDRIGARISAAIVSANPAIAAILAVPLFEESFTAVTAGGLLCIVAGGVVLQTSETGEGTHDDLLVEELAEVDLRDLLVPLVAMTMLGCSFVLVKMGLNSIDDSLVGTAIGQTAALLAFLALFGASGTSRRQVGIRDRTALVAFTLAGVFVAGNWLAWFSALRIGTVVTVVPLSNVYPLVVVAISYLAIRRVPRSPRILGGITAIVVGATLMQLA